jgi:hypothetical protein
LIAFHAVHSIHAARRCSFRVFDRILAAIIAKRPLELAALSGIDPSAAVVAV